jgi:hypothetical protein
MPPTITYEEAKEFSLFMLRAVLNGRANELIDLARRPNFYVEIFHLRHARSERNPQSKRPCAL